MNNQFPCLKIKDIITLIKKLEKIKKIIKECNGERTEKIENIYNKEGINELEKKYQLLNLDKRLKLSIKKYVLLHNKLYNVIESIYSCECCMNSNKVCKKGSGCLKNKDNDKFWEITDELHNEIDDFYTEVETMLVVETEICFHKLNKIKKINYF